MKDLPETFQLVNQCCSFLIKKLLLDTNASDATNVLQGFHDANKSYGDFEISVRKIVRTTGMDPIGIFKGKKISEMSRSDLIDFAEYAAKRIPDLERIAEKHAELDLMSEAGSFVAPKK